MLDLVFHNLTFCEVNRNVFPLVDEDNHHPALEINIRLAIKNPPKFKNNIVTTKHNFRSANFIELYKMLETYDWSPIYHINDVKKACFVFYNHLYSILDLHVPKFKRNKVRFLKWYSSVLQRNIFPKKQVIQ